MAARTKIVATVGPACEQPDRIAALVEAGVDVFRLNLSHGDPESRARQLETIRAVEARVGHPVAVMADLCGPKIRVRPLVGGRVELADGATITLRRGREAGTADAITTTLDELVDAVRPGDPVLLDDGKLRLEVLQPCGDGVVCRVVYGGPLSDGKGVNLPATRLPIDTLTAKDRRDVAWIAAHDIDLVALSFVRSADDIEQLRRLLVEAGCDAQIVAKVEKPEAVAAIESIVAASDAVMVARGDLGVEMELPEVPAAQKRIAALCLRSATPCIVATQMLESMTTSPRPTRAEVSDVANAVYDQADAVMLSGETAVGRFPVEAVAMMNRIALRSEEVRPCAPSRYDPVGEPTAAALASAVRTLVDAEPIAAIGVYTVSGATARLLARTRPGVPIVALSPDPGAARRLNLVHGVLSGVAPAPEHTRQVIELLEAAARAREVATDGQRLVVLSGRPVGVAGATNTLVVHRLDRPSIP
jgi:pyruvate kinase